ncbi:MAG: hypothetical protein WBV94_05670 [Blastocatellia bacterium]
MDHAPTAGELLERRVASGWSPTPTSTRAGDVIQGYAQCLYSHK